MAVKKERVSAYEKMQSQRKALVDKVIANMEKGYIWDSGWDINALRSQNPVSGAKYNGINKLHLGYVIAENNYQDPRFVTFKQAQDKGWKVKKGEHGYQCEYWIWNKEEEITNEKGEKEKVEVPLEKPMVRQFTVFNLEQIEGDYPKFELPKLSHDEILDVANDFIASSRCPIKEVAQSRAYYSPTNDNITLPLRDSFKSSEDYLATLLHEMAHSTGQELGRKMSTGGQMSPEYAKEELVAELSSLFLKAELGLSTEGKHFENHSAYLNGWNSMLKSDPNELYRAAKEADKACAYIMERYREYVNTKEITKENTIEKEEVKINDPIDKLSVTLHFSEYDFNIPDETTLHGKEAYNLLKEIMQYDKKFNMERIAPYYDKTFISISYDNEDIIKNTRLDLGDRVFNGADKPSEGIEALLPRYLSMIEYPEAFEHLNKSKEEIVQEGTRVVKGVKLLKKVLVKEEAKENKILNSLKKIKTKEVKKPKVKEEPKKIRVRTRTKKGLEI